MRLTLFEPRFKRKSRGEEEVVVVVVCSCNPSTLKAASSLESAGSQPSLLLRKRAYLKKKERKLDGS